MALSQAAEFVQLHGSSAALLFIFPFVLLAIQFTFQAIRNIYFSPLKEFPGPKVWAATPLPWLFTRSSGNTVWKLLQLHEKYGRVVRITPNELSWIDEGVWKDVWGHRQGHQEFMKHPDGRARHPNGLYGILSADRADHSRYRRLLSHSFSEKGMREQQPIITSYVNLLISRLREHSSQGSQDMVSWFNWTTFDIIGRLSFGDDFGCLKSATTHPWIDAIFGNLKAVVMLNTIRRLGLAWVIPYLASDKTIRMRQFNYDYSSERIEERVKRGSEEGDFLDNVLKHNGEKVGMTLEELKSNASNLVLAGSETTATLLSGCIYQLCQNHEALKKVTAEVRGAFKSSDDIDLFSSGQLKYTLAVLDETMRIYPPVPTQSSRVVPEGGDTVMGKWLPGGTGIQLPQYVAGHLKSNFTRPEEFIPERFLGAPEFGNDNYAVLQPFSVGPRNCIGRNLAYAEMRLILAKFLYNFDIEIDEKTGKWTDQKTFILWEKHPLWVRLTPVN